jgi:hypothetical protein
LYILTTDLSLLTVTLINDREGTPHEQDSNCQKLISDHEPQMGLDTKTDSLTDHQSQCDFDFEKLVGIKDSK